MTWRRNPLYKVVYYGILGTIDGRRHSERSEESNMAEKQGYIYILTNVHNKVLYTGVTSDLVKRVYEHKNKLVDGFTKKYNVHKLVYFEILDGMINAITREKQIKGWLRSKKIALIEANNSEWKDLYEGLV